MSLLFVKRRSRRLCLVFLSLPQVGSGARPGLWAMPAASVLAGAAAPQFFPLDGSSEDDVGDGMEPSATTARPGEPYEVEVPEVILLETDMDEQRVDAGSTPTGWRPSIPPGLPPRGRARPDTVLACLHCGKLHFGAGHTQCQRCGGQGLFDTRRPAKHETSYGTWMFMPAGSSDPPDTPEDLQAGGRPHQARRRRRRHGPPSSSAKNRQRVNTPPLTRWSNLVLPLTRCSNLILRLYGLFPRAHRRHEQPSSHRLRRLLTSPRVTKCWTSFES